VPSYGSDEEYFAGRDETMISLTDQQLKIVMVQIRRSRR
jgi:hypothetical protein